MLLGPPTGVRLHSLDEIHRLASEAPAKEIVSFLGIVKVVPFPTILFFVVGIISVSPRTSSVLSSYLYLCIAYCIPLVMIQVVT